MRVSSRLLSLVLATSGFIACGLQASAQAVSLSVIQQYAPSIYLNAYDNNHPASVDSFFAQSILLGPNGNTIASTVTPAVLAANTPFGNYMTPTNGVFPSSSNDFESGSPITSIGNNTGLSTAPVYVKTIDNGNSIDLKYYLFYTWNGFQGFQAGVITDFVTQPYYFNWASFALHYGDWEHVTVRISEDTTTLLGVFYSEHGDAAFVANPSMDGTHPIVYSGWNSHANYPTSGNNINTTILNSPGVIPLSWLKVTDVTTNNGTFEVYHQPNPFYSNGVEWLPWQNTSQLVLLDNNATAAQWLSFLGYWGPTVKNVIDDPPSGLPSGSPTELYTLATAGSTLGLLSNYQTSSGPLGPEAQGWNVSNELPAAVNSPVTSGQTYVLVNANSGSVLDDPGASTSNGTDLDQWQADGGTNQQWVATANGNFWTFTNVASGKLLDDPAGSTSASTQLDQWQSNGGTNQNWTIASVGDGSYMLVNEAGNLVMDVSGGSTANGAEIIQYGNDGGTNQHWFFQPVAAQSTTYQANSSGTIAGGSVVQACSGCSSGQDAGYLGEGGTLTFSSVTVSTAGTYFLTISYEDGDSGRSATLTVNGSARTLSFTGLNNNNWTTPQKMIVPVNLNAGNNTIEFSNTSGWAPNIDEIIVN
jgi:hypothetical protein